MKVAASAGGCEDMMCWTNLVLFCSAELSNRFWSVLHIHRAQHRPKILLHINASSCRNGGGAATEAQGASTTVNSTNGLRGANGCLQRPSEATKTKNPAGVSDTQRPQMGQSGGGTRPGRAQQDPSSAKGEPTLEN